MPEFLQRTVKQVAFAMRATAAAIIVPDEAGGIIESAFDTADGSFGFESLRSKSVDSLPLLGALREAITSLGIARTVPPALVDAAHWKHSEAQASAARTGRRQAPPSAT